MRSGASPPLDTGSRREFVDYYVSESLTPATRQRFESVKAKVLGLAHRHGVLSPPLRVLDIGCGAGTQCRIWAESGHIVSGIDINQELIEVARERASKARLGIDFGVGTASKLPYAANAIDVCLMPELLEHVTDWQSCLTEAVRVLRSGGILYLSTTNVLCPKQQEFTLPLYSWYPPFLKRHFEMLAVTDRPELVNHARYPAVHWFSYYGLSRFLGLKGMTCFDRFDMLEPNTGSLMRRTIVWILKRSALLRFLGQVCTSGTSVYAIKNWRQGVRRSYELRGE